MIHENIDISLVNDAKENLILIPDQNLHWLVRLQPA